MQVFRESCAKNISTAVSVFFDYSDGDFVVWFIGIYANHKQRAELEYAVG